MTNVLVIGAGAAGLAAAHRLQQQGVAVQVLEASSAIGGRIRTSHDLADYPVEIGAEYVHDSQNAVMQHLLTQADMRLHDGAHLGNMYFSLQGTVERQPAPRDYLSDLKDEAAQCLRNGHTNMTVATCLAQSSFAPDERPIVEAMVVSEMGCALESIGIQGLLEGDFSGYSGDERRVHSAYDTLVHWLARGLDVQNNMPVRTVHAKPSPAVECANGERLSADAIIVTVPLAILQQRRLTFTPELPPTKQHAIDALGCSQTTRVHLRFAEPWWPQDMESLLTDTPSQIWWRPGMHRTNEQPLLTALIGGPAARNFADASDVVVQRLHDELQTVWGGASVPDVHAANVVAWNEEPFIFMGYSYLPAGCPPEARRQYAAPWGAIHFAGEATEGAHAATVHGALESGIRAAEEVLGVR